MKYTLAVLQRQKKPACKRRPDHLDSSAWCLWIVHERDFHLQAKMDLRICDHKVGFPEYSHN